MRTPFIHLDINLEWFLFFIFHTSFTPPPVVETALPISKRAFGEFDDPLLRGANLCKVWKDGTSKGWCERGDRGL